MAEFKLGRIKFVYQGAWTTGTSYVVDDVVTVNGKTYICVISHTASSLFATDQTVIPTKWNLVADGTKWLGAWEASTYYNLGDMVQWGGIVYICNTAHTSATFTSPTFLGLENDQSKWDSFAANFNWLGAWEPSTRYKVRDLVTYGGYTYVCNTYHTSAESLGLEYDQNKWDVFNAGIIYQGAWTQSTRYRLNDLVKYGADIWICTTAHASSSSFDSTKFNVFVNGFEFASTWSNSTAYVVGDLVTYGGNTYTAIQNGTGQNPETQTGYWRLFITGFTFIGDWNSSTTYLIGDVVRLGAYTYVATADSTNQTPPNTSFWQRLNTGVRWFPTTSSYSAVAGTNISSSGSSATFDVALARTAYSVTVHSGSAGSGYAVNDTIKILGSSLGGISPANDVTLTVTGVSSGAITTLSASGYSVTWVSGTSYVLGDAVYFGASTYICVNAHVAILGNRPDADTTATYWNVLANGAESAVLTTQGDMFFYGANGPQRLPIGTDGQVLRVNNNTPAWQYYGSVNNVVYVANNGADVSTNGQGTTIDKPWKTIRYAAKQIEDGYLNTNSRDLLAKNKQFVMKEASAYVVYNYSFNVASASSANNQFTLGSGSYQATTANMSVNMPISFTGTTGGVTAGTTYYVLAIVDSTHFTITATYGGAVAVTLTSGSSAMTGSLVYNTTKCERDVGLIMDAVVFDLSHGGTQQVTAAALSYFTSPTSSTFITTAFGYEASQSLATYNYMKNTLVASVLNQTAPGTNYQSLVGSTNVAQQIIDNTLTAESGALTTVQNVLLSTITNALTAGTATAIPTASNPNTTISIKTGTYNETLPIVIPKNTAVVGDELRSTVVQPAPAVATLVNDKPKSIAALNRVRALIPSIMSNTPVLPTTGNTQSQSYLFNTGLDTASASIAANINTMTAILSSGDSAAPVPTITDPSGYDTGYFNARRLIVANTQFLKDEVTAYMVLNYSSLWTSLGATGQASCTRDIGYIVQALQYDLTYQGNLATVIAARAYYSNGTFVEASGEKTAALAVQTRIGAIISNIAQGVTITRTTGNTTTQVTSGTTGSSSAGTFAAARITEIYNTINTGTAPTTIAPSTSFVSTALTTANTNIRAQQTALATSVLSWVNTTFPGFYYNQTTCSRDVGYIVDALCYDMMFAGNFLSIWNAMSYYRALTSTQLVVSSQLAPTMGTVAFIGASLREITSGNFNAVGSTVATASVKANAELMYDIVNNGISNVPSFVLPTLPGYNSSFLSGYGDGKAQIVQNYVFIKADVSAYLSNNYSSVWTALGTTGQANCQRDIGYILDALQYDMTYGTNTQTLIAGSSYYSNYVLTIGATEKAAIVAAYGFLKTEIGNIVTKTAITPQSGNAQNQVTSGTAGSAGASTFAQARIQEILDWINNGAADAAITPVASGAFALAPLSLQASYTALQAKKSEIQSDTVVWVQKFFQSMNFNSVTCSRDAGYIVDALSYDLLFGSNFNSITVGRAYNRSTTSALVVLNTQKAAELGSINFIKYKAKAIAAGGAVAQAGDLIDNITGYITNGSTPRFLWPDPSNITATTAQAAKLIYQNKAFIAAELFQYITTNYSSVVYSKVTCQRDVNYIVDSLRYDMTYGGDYATKQAGKAYYSALTSQFEIASSEKAATLAAYGVLKSIVQDIAASTSTYTPLQTGVTRVTGLSGGSSESTTVGNLVTVLTNIVNNGLVSGVPTVTITTIASGTTFTTSAAHGLNVGDEVIPQSTANGMINGTSYYVASTPLTTTFTLAATWGGSALTSFTSGTSLSIVAETTNQPGTSWVASAMTTSAATLSAAKATIQSSITSYLTTNYPNLVYNSATCIRDVGIIIDAISYDFMMNSNYRTHRAATSYYRAQAAVVIASQKAATIAAMNYLQLQIATTLSANATALASANSNMTMLVAILTNGVGETPEVHGTLTYNNTLTTIKGAELIRANRNFLAYEAAAYIAATYGGTVSSTTASNTFTTTTNHNLSVGDPVNIKATIVTTTATATTSSTNQITVGTTVGMTSGMKITFTGTVFGGLVSGTTYFVLSVVDGTHITISSSQNGSVFTVTTAAGSVPTVAGGLLGGVSSFMSGSTTQYITYYVLSVPTPTTFTLTTTQAGTGTQTAVSVTNASGAMTVVYSYVQASCLRDTVAYLDAMVYDLQFTGNYKSLRAAKLYNNAVGGSQTENMWLARNGTGVRNMTMSGLSGYLTNPNAFGTRRPTAGAYTSLDPGFGPNDSNVWITSRSPYTQNCTMFGTACSGAKVDGALHAGGNRSMVANDYTTIISDGIGYWVTGSNALTELVSVFNYYGYAGYLAELGARIRATNGNSSYGTYGVVAEGTDTYEVPTYGTLNNRANPAYITNVVTDGTNQVLRIEYENAGQNYTNSVVSINGSGFNAAATQDEFRDAALFETRIQDAGNGQGVGGSGHVTATNTAQGGGVGYITIAATDTALTSAYNGMRIQLLVGTGVGQYANILSYTNGSKIAQIYKDSFNNLTVTATTTSTNLITVASTATLYVGMPVYFGTAVGGLSANTVYYVIAAGLTSTQFSVSTSSGGTAVALSTTTGQSVTLYAAGWDHIIPGTAIQNVPDLTSGYIIEARVNYSAPGYTATARTMPASSTWSATTYGAGNYVAVANASTATAYSTTGKTWTSGGVLPSSTTWNNVVYAGGQNATATAVVGGLGGSNAVLQAVIGTGTSATQIVSVNIISGGFNFNTPPTILFTGGGGSGATATCTVLNGAITSVTMVINGSGYTSTPTVTAVTSALTSINTVTWGRNYFSAPTVTVAQPQGLTPSAYPVSGAVTNGTYYQVAASGRIYLCTISGTTSSTTPTFDYTSAVQTQVNGTATLQYVATQAQATPTLTNTGVSSIALTINGYGYTTTPAVTILDTAARFVTISNASTASAYSTVANLGTSWTSGGNLPVSNLNGLAYGGGYLVAVGGTSTTPSASSSTDGGTTWINRSGVITGSVTYSAVAYGNGYFVAIPASGNTTTICTNGQNWSAGGNLPSSTTWTSIAYGNGRFVAIASGSNAAAVSINNGTNWVASSAGLPASATWSSVGYGAGLFFAVAKGTQTVATSPDGINWTAQLLSSSSNWSSVTFGNPVSATLGNQPLWVAISNTSGTIAASIRTGATALGRVKSASGALTELRVIEPGSGYPKGNVTATTTSTNLITVDDTTNLVANQPIEFSSATGGLSTNTVYYVISGSITSTQFQVSATSGSSTPVTLTTTAPTGIIYRAAPVFSYIDPNKVNVASLRARMGDGVLGNPSFSNRGSNNATATATTAGDGYSDLYQNSSYVNIAGLYSIPAAGSNVTFGGIANSWYKLVSVTNVLGIPGAYTATFQVNPAMSTALAPAHGSLVTTTLKYSQVRLTGHDFLYIGTGNQTQTNYPFVVAANANQANQQLFSGGGRVFFTSTDQDGNFNVGNLFGVQQATGTATLNASAFNLAGLQSLQLGAVSLGVGSAVITQFSTDPYFTANSDSVVPTQKAIKAYITAQIGGGSSSLNVNTLTSGQIYVANNTILNTTGNQILVTSKMNFVGGIDGAPVALTFFGQR